MKIWILILGALLLQFSASGQALSFYAEDLTFRLSPGLFEVDGYYYFRNTTDKPVRQTLLYPFPDEAAYGTIGSISIRQGSDSISFKRTLRGILFTVTAAARQEVTCKIGYSQQLIFDSACYIITTTQRWKQPFEWATYQLRMPDSLKLEMVSIIPDSTGHAAGEDIYFWRRFDFMPDKDFMFYY
ncbi:MAG: hypothetical protein PHX39_02160 [Bacteroidales bacterium]|nr:hypothetical protein [Bacteroidales bacterium]